MFAKNFEFRVIKLSLLINMQDESRRGRDLIYVKGSNQINAVQYKWQDGVDDGESDSQ